MKKSDKKYLKTVNRRFSDKYSRVVQGGIKPYYTVYDGIDGSSVLFYVEQSNIPIGTSTGYSLPFGVDLDGRIITDGYKLYVNEIGGDGGTYSYDVNDPSTNIWLGGSQYGSHTSCDGNLYFVCNSDTGDLKSYSIEDGSLVDSCSPGYGESYGLASNGDTLVSLFSGVLCIVDSTDFTSSTDVVDLNIATNSSICISDDRLYYTSYDGVANSYIKSLKLSDGSLIDSTTLIPVIFTFKSSICTDGELVFVQYEDIGPVICCYTRDLKLIWSKTITSYANIMVDEKYLYYVDNIGGSLSNLVIMDKYHGTEIWRSGDYSEMAASYPCTDGSNVFILYHDGVNYVIRKFSTGKNPIYMKVLGTDKQRKPMFNLAVPLP